MDPETIAETTECRLLPSRSAPYAIVLYRNTFMGEVHTSRFTCERGADETAQRLVKMEDFKGRIFERYEIVKTVGIEG